jgi:hypothetical protein
MIGIARIIMMMVVGGFWCKPHEESVIPALIRGVTRALTPDVTDAVNTVGDLVDKSVTDQPKPNKANCSKQYVHESCIET